MTTIPLYIETIHEDIYVGVAKVLKVGKKVYRPDADGLLDGFSRHVTLAAPRGVSAKDVKRAVQMTMRYQCDCSHDCCGCYQQYAGVPRRIRRRNWSVEVRYVPNC